MDINGFFAISIQRRPSLRGRPATLDQDPESNTHHAQFRNYAPTQGRWLTPDPYSGSYDITNPQSMNRYAYVLNNPLSFLDPAGLWATQPVQCGTDDSGNPIYCMSAGNGDCYNSDVCLNSGYSGGLVWYCGEYGGCGQTGPNPQPPQNPAPSKPTLTHIFACAFAAPVLGAAKAINRTVGAGVGGSAGAGVGLGLFASIGLEVVADPGGNAGLIFNLNTGVFGAGIGAQGGGQISISTAQNISALSGGPSGNFGGSVGVIGADISHTPGGSTTGTVTVGPGVGGDGGALTAGYSGILASTNCSDIMN